MLSPKRDIYIIPSKRTLQKRGGRIYEEELYEMVASEHVMAAVSTKSQQQ